MTSDHLGENGGYDENNYHRIEAEIHHYNFRRSLTCGFKLFYKLGPRTKVKINYVIIVKNPSVMYAE